ncbi:MAG TPA: ORF6N domain-containing protein [Vicinamibacteria bacterium]|nr:ORF6N domain-containing protein [Vicinamibacteria bacterium]
MPHRRAVVTSPVTQRAEKLIVLIRGHKVIIDVDLARLYGVTTGRLNEQVRRNRDRFPDDFMFELTAEEAAALRSQSAISKTGRGGRRYRPLAFTEQGVAMLSSVLRSARAVQVNIAIMRAFVGLREMLASHRELAARLDQMEKTYEAQFKVVFDAIRALVEVPPRSARKIGFRTLGSTSSGRGV